MRCLWCFRVRNYPPTCGRRIDDMNPSAPSVARTDPHGRPATRSESAGAMIQVFLSTRGTILRCAQSADDMTQGARPMGSISAVVAAAVAFVGGHFLLSHPLRRGLVRAIGEPGFQGLYSVVAIVTFGWLILAYRKAPLSAPLWPVGDGLWAVATAFMLIASILLMGSLIRNPALPTGGRPASFPEAPRGVYAVTRHPMMWSFALWGLCHIAVYPVTR